MHPFEPAVLFRFADNFEHRKPTILNFEFFTNLLFIIRNGLQALVFSDFTQQFLFVEILKEPLERLLVKLQLLLHSLMLF